MRTSLVITTYNRPDALRLVLESVLLQSQLPDEIVIADDGSAPPTRSVIETFAARSPVPVIHAWQEDQGFRLARVRNLALSRASGDYVIFIDGDLILHPEFIASHLRMARPRFYLQGRRAMLSTSLTRTILSRSRISISPFEPGITLRKRAFHDEMLARWLSYESTYWHKSLGANLSVWMQDVIAVNGFNEDFQGWGREDSEFVMRLKNAGVRKTELRFCAVAFHLAHGNDNREKYLEDTAANQKLLENTLSLGIVHCTNGLDKHLTPTSTRD